MVDKHRFDETVTREPMTAEWCVQLWYTTRRNNQSMSAVCIAATSKTHYAASVRHL